MTIIHDVDATPPQPPVVTMRLATSADIDAIKTVVDANVALGHLLPRSREHIAAALGNWMVADAARLWGLARSSKWDRAWSRCARWQCCLHFSAMGWAAQLSKRWSTKHNDVATQRYLR